ncbi:hypothetical protein OHA77_10125 [Streptosporangium sp. NBC_01639]|uniref:hypothetical protein n=1 Tax=unclassified Streptosporangium TaxID=2632669 RepID=UPI002DD86C31|nr:hypothetical protein [Streptosporangium sp. NBC_01756]WSC84505.1 hypothetical protein OIE48_29550 [Streptosporangium sp. NBC_01756]WTD56862.1 hypothetical protein OHA77_10125 [Streptosporangium sp. NBC_01639]
MHISSIVRSAAMALTALALVSTVSACGGGDSTAGSAGAGNVDKATLIDKMKEKPESKDIPTSTMDCMVGVLMKHGDQATLQGIIDGKVNIDNDFKAFGAKEKQVQEEIDKCL